MRRRVLLMSLSSLALASLAGLVVLALDPEMIARLATQLGQSTLNTGRGVVSYLGWAAPLSTALFAVLVRVVAGGFRTFVAHRGLSDTWMTAKHAFAPVASATVSLVAIFAHDRPVVVAGVGVVPLVGAGAVFVDRSNARGVVTGLLHAVTPVVGGGAVVSLVAGPVVARAVTLAFPLAVGYVLGVASTRGWFRFGAAVSAFASVVPAWMYFPPVAEAVGFDPETVGFALGSAIATALLSLPFAAIDYATTRTADAERQAGVSPAVSAVE